MALSKSYSIQWFECKYCRKRGPKFDSDYGFSDDCKGWYKMLPLASMNEKDLIVICPECIKNLINEKKE